ncbi:MAG: hypothetical protein HFI67_07860 [Lachnospiraceae bacterium]|jgi:hypothetical protein|nr:hypothetical protein [Lachnospiraceae bacterium]
MGMFRKMRAAFHDDWCSKCLSEMDKTGKRLFMLPMTVGHYVSHSDADYYRRNLQPVSKKGEIPPGVYACGIISYRCPECGYRRTKLSVFLPVRDEEKYEDAICFEQGELDDLL